VALKRGRGVTVCLLLLHDVCAKGQNEQKCLDFLCDSLRSVNL
jgi:hypothetical protein